MNNKIIEFIGWLFTWIGFLGLALYFLIQIIGY